MFKVCTTFFITFYNSLSGNCDLSNSNDRKNITATDSVLYDTRSIPVPKTGKNIYQIDRNTILKTMTPFWLHTLFTFFLSMVPVFELRAAIPLGYLQWDLSIWWAAGVSILGNILIGLCLLWFLPKTVLFLDKRILIVRKFFQWLFKKIHGKYHKKWVLFGETLLVILVSLPIPGFGVWLGAFLAYVFGVKTTTAALLLSIGVVFAGIIVSLLTLGGHLIFKAFT